MTLLLLVCYITRLDNASHPDEPTLFVKAQGNKLTAHITGNFISCGSHDSEPSHYLSFFRVYLQNAGISRPRGVGHMEARGRTDIQVIL